MRVVDTVVAQPHGVVFPWPAGMVITALCEAVLAIPAAVLKEEEPIGDVIVCDDGVGLQFPQNAHPTPSDVIYIRLQRGQQVSLTRSCTACSVSQPSYGPACNMRIKYVEQE